MQRRRASKLVLPQFDGHESEDLRAPHSDGEGLEMRHQCHLVVWQELVAPARRHVLSAPSSSHHITPPPPPHPPPLPSPPPSPPPRPPLSRTHLSRFTQPESNVRQ